MMTQNQIKALFYNALVNDASLQAIIGDRLYWIAKPTETDTFPLITYTIFDTTGSYVFDNFVSASNETYTIQFNIYAGPSDLVNMDAIYERLKAVLVPLCFRNITTPQEFLEESINKVIRPVRFEYINV